MKIKILGTRGEIPESLPYHSKHTGILIDDQLLIDLGEKQFLQYNPKWILFTHFHPDHAYFVRHKSEEIPPIQATVYGPEDHQLLMDKVHMLNKKKKIGPYTVTPIPTLHSKHVKSQAYLVKKGKESFFFTGDLFWIKKEDQPLIGQVDLIISEASFIQKGGMVRRDPKTGQVHGHNGVPNIISLLKSHSKNFLFIHFGPWFYANENAKKSRKALIALGKEHGIKVLVGYDGMQIDLAEYEL